VDHRSLITDHRLLFYLLSLFFFALGLMSKPMLVTWPFVMLLLDYWPLRRFELSTLNSQPSTILRLVREKIPFFVLTALMSAVTVRVQRHAGVLAAGETLPLGGRLGNAVISYVRYVGKTLWPTELVAVYPHPGQWPLWQVLLAGGLIVGVSLLVWVPRRRSPYLLMGWLWYCGTLVPVSQVIQTGGHAIADRWTYVPSLGLVILAVWGASELTRHWRYRALALSCMGGAAIFLCLALTRHQIGYWKDSEILFRHALEVTVNNDAAHNGLGVALDEKGQFSEAIPHFLESIRLNPNHADVHYNLGVAFYQTGRIDEAILQFMEAIRMRPDHAQAHNNLGTALGMKGQTDEAIRQFQEALRLKPDYAEAQKNLDIVLATKARSSPLPRASTNP
jgi:hypothetical protein